MRRDPRCSQDRRWQGWLVAIVFAMAVSFWAAPLSAAPVRVQYPEGPAHGYVVLSDLNGKALAHGELTQLLERRAIVSRLVFRFDDGSIYDEVIRFSQDRTFRLLSYHLVQKGPSFTESSDIRFDDAGHYKARVRSSPDKKEEEATGTIALPNDVSNGMTSMLLRNLRHGESATMRILAFDPKPRILELHLKPDGTTSYWVGRQQATATRYRVEPEVTGVTGVFATIVGKQPSSRYMWLAEGKPPMMIRFEGPLGSDGPVWRVELSAPRWEN
jgi:hypothetical protein